MARHLGMVADFDDPREPSTQERAPMPKVDQIEELIRVLGERGIEPKPARGRSDVLSFPDRRQRPDGRK